MKQDTRQPIYLVACLSILFDRLAGAAVSQSDMLTKNICSQQTKIKDGLLISIYATTTTIIILWMDVFRIYIQICGNYYLLLLLLLKVKRYLFCKANCHLGELYRHFKLHFYKTVFVGLFNVALRYLRKRVWKMTICPKFTWTFNTDVTESKNNLCTFSLNCFDENKSLRSSEGRLQLCTTFELFRSWASGDWIGSSRPPNAVLVNEPRGGCDCWEAPVSTASLNVERPTLLTIYPFHSSGSVRSSEP